MITRELLSTGILKGSVLLGLGYYFSLIILYPFIVAYILINPSTVIVKIINVRSGGVSPLFTACHSGQWTVRLTHQITSRQSPTRPNKNITTPIILFTPTLYHKGKMVINYIQTVLIFLPHPLPPLQPESLVRNHRY
jgi:hypothetical protein